MKTWGELKTWMAEHGYDDDTEIQLAVRIPQLDVLAVGKLDGVGVKGTRAVTLYGR